MTDIPLNIDQNIKIALLASRLDGLNHLINLNDASIKEVEKHVETRYEKIERYMERIDSKIWSLLLWTIGGFAGVFGLLAHIKGWI